MTPDLAAEAHAPLTPPSIGVAVGRGTPQATVEAVLRGLEEESVPGDVRPSDELNPLALAHQAATASRLGVGVGLSLDYAVVTVDKLPADRPYLAQRLTNPARQGRLLGANAARLVRRTPLKETMS